MRKLILLLFVVLFVNLQAQSDFQEGWNGRIGGGGGVSGFFIKPDLTPISNFLDGVGVGNFVDNGVFGFGGGGFAYLMVFKNFRIGGVGFGASNSKSIVKNGFNKEVAYNYGGGGLTVEYTLPSVYKVSLSVGALIGGASAELDIYQNKGSIDWNSLSSDFVNTQSSKILSHKLKNGFFVFAPTLNLDVPVNRFLVFRLGGGYLIPLNNEWKVDNGITLTNFPSDMNSKAYFVQIGIYFGFFIFN